MAVLWMPGSYMMCIGASMSESEGCSVQYNSAIPSLPGHFHSNHQHRLGLAAHCKKGSINGSCDCWRRPHCLHMLPRSPVLMTRDHSSQYSTTTLRKVAVYLQVKLQETFPRGKLDQPHL